MKKILFYISILVFAAACKKDSSGSSSEKMYLSKIYFKGLLETEYIYSGDHKLIRTNHYSTGLGQSTLSVYRLYNYNADGTIKEVFSYSSSHYATTRKIYTWSQGKLTRIDEASVFTGTDDLEDMDYYEVFSYDGSGRLKNVIRRLTNAAVHSRRDFSYDGQGNLANYSSTFNDDGDMLVKEETAVGVGGKPFPEHWKAMLTTPAEGSLIDLFIPGKKYTSYWLGPVGTVYTWSYINREFNNQGYVTKQTEQLESNGSVNTNDKTFEYIQ